MTLAVYLLPLAAAFVLPPFLARSRRAGAIALAAIMIVAAVLGFAVGALLPVTLFLTACAVLFAGLHLALVALRVPPVGAQIASGLLAVALWAAVFALGPIVRNARETAMPGEELQGRIHLIMTVTPYPALAASVFHDNPLQRPVLYATDAADYYPPAAIPPWSAVALRYGLVGALCLLVAGLVGRKS